MNNHELKVIRKVLNLSEAEAATYLGEEMGQKTWNFYERHHINNYGVKPYIMKKIQKLLIWRKDFIRDVLENKSKSTPIIHYNDQNDFSDILLFKAHYAATSTLNIDYGYNLIVFNKDEYTQYIESQKLEDNEESKQKWAEGKYAQIINTQSMLSTVNERLEIQKSALAALCFKANLSHTETIEFISRLKTVSQKTDDSYKEALNEYLVKMLPHTLHYAENKEIKVAITQQTAEYIEQVKKWARLYHQTKELIEAPFYLK